MSWANERLELPTADADSDFDSDSVDECDLSSLPRLLLDTRGARPSLASICDNGCQREGKRGRGRGGKPTVDCKLFKQASANATLNWMWLDEETATTPQRADSSPPRSLLPTNHSVNIYPKGKSKIKHCLSAFPPSLPLSTSSVCLSLS